MKRIALLFAGQGSQYIGMGKSLYDRYQVFRETYEEASDVLKMDMYKMCYRGSMELLSITENTQPALLTYGVAAYRALQQEIGIKPQLAAGHSLGEVTALCCSGALKFEDGLKIARLRANLMQQCRETKNYIMAAVEGVDKQLVEDACREAVKQQINVEVACYNTAKQTVLTGSRQDVEAVCRQLEASGADIRMVNISVSSHCSKLKEASKALLESLLKYSFKPLSWPVISNVDAMPYGEPSEIPEKLARQLVSPVLWLDTMKYMQQQGIDFYIDIGPKSTLKKFALTDNGSLTVLSVDNREDFSKLIEMTERDDNSYYSAFIAKCMAIAASTKNNCYDEAGYFDGVVKPSRQLRQIFLQCENGMQNCNEIVYNALECLETILKTKKVPEDEQSSLIMEAKKAVT